MTAMVLPAGPRPVPGLPADPAAIAECGVQLMAVSAQLDDLGTFATGPARVGEWSGQAATAYHDSAVATGVRGEAMSLALRSLARRVEVHAAVLGMLARRRAELEERRGRLVQELVLLRQQASGRAAGHAPAFADRCDQVAARVSELDADVVAWSAEVAAEQQGLAGAFVRTTSLHDVDHRYAGTADPADAALASRPGAGASPHDVDAWWDQLAPHQQRAVVVASPGSVGDLDGVPAGVRHDANLVALTRDLADWGKLEDAGLLDAEERRALDNARSADRALETIGQRSDPATGLPIVSQLYLYDPTGFEGDGRVAVAAGDLGAADNLAVLVPGFGSDAQSVTYLAERAATVYESTRFLDGTASNATMSWIGYDAPDNLPWAGEGWDGASVLSEHAAAAGGERLAGAVEGLRAAREGPPAHLTTVGHSYGSTTAGHAAHAHGLVTDDLVLLGSPGAGERTDTAAETGIEPGHVWAGANSRDPVTYLANHGWVHGETLLGAGLGDDPAEDDFGAIRFQAESTTRGGLPALGQHSLYFDHGTESLHNLSQVVNGRYDEVARADHVHDPWWAGVQDPEHDREPTAPETR